MTSTDNRYKRKEAPNKDVQRSKASLIGERPRRRISRDLLSTEFKCTWKTVAVTKLGLSFVSIGIILSGFRSRRLSVRGFMPDGYKISLIQKSPVQLSHFADQRWHTFTTATSSVSPKVGIHTNKNPNPTTSKLSAATSSEKFIAPLKVETEKLSLSTGITAEIMTCNPANPQQPHKKPLLVFIHGSFHSSWCWAEHFMPFFAHHGYSSVAISLRGTNGTPAGDGVKKVQIQKHVDDITSLLYCLQNDGGLQQQASSDDAIPPVLLAHSFGGLTVMKYLERLLHSQESKEKNKKDYEAPLPLSGCCVMCSVPPSGNGKMTLRFLRRSLNDSYKLTVGFAMKKAITDKKLCRELFFGYSEDDDYGISEEHLAKIQERFERDTAAMIDLPDLAKQLPSKLVMKSENGKVSFAGNLPPSLVIGATRDFVVDKEGVDETAAYFGLCNEDGSGPIWVDSPHDVMLGSNWLNAANVILNWLDNIATSDKKDTKK